MHIYIYVAYNSTYVYFYCIIFTNTFTNIFYEHHYKRLLRTPWGSGASARESPGAGGGACALKGFVKVGVKVLVKMFVKGIHKD